MKKYEKKYFMLVMRINSTENQLFKNLGDFYINCPHCDDIIYITKIKCAMFLHAVDKTTMKQLSPHSKWYQVDKLKRDGNMVGCGERFWLQTDHNGTIISSREKNQV